MFSPESIISPIILSYVDKYIKNFRPEQSELSLWGGDMTFHNLDLRLEVLEQELQLPFSFVSGHIHELIIHVPWTKIASESVTITINTIECILKLRSSDSSPVSDAASQQKERLKPPTNKKEESEAPPGYVQSLVNKIAGNIKIFCNNLILKYVEEDIVLSMNIRLLTIEAANNRWEPAFIGSDFFPILRKLIVVSDLTICLDKRNAAGKIDVYQEPILYRSLLTIHMLKSYNSVNAKWAATTRFDIHCDSMEFSMTEQQVPMFMRIMMLLIALQQKQLKPHSDSQVDLTATTSELRETQEAQESWAGWALSFIPSLGLYPWNEDWNNGQQTSGNNATTHIGFYVDCAWITFKVSECRSDRGYYSQKKMKYLPILVLRLQGIFSDTVMHGMSWCNVSCGISIMELVPVGLCTCSHIETTANYLKAGTGSRAYKTDSLFDAEAVENKGQRKSYNTSWDLHLNTITKEAMLERTPAFAVDYLYQLEMPDDTSNETLSEFSGDLEYSNFYERSLLRVVVGPLKLSLLSGLFHRISSLQVAASAYDYSPYSTPKPDPLRNELPPPRSEDFDALNEHIPSRMIQITVIEPVIELQPLDHPHFTPTRSKLFRTSKHKVTPPQVIRDALPRITLECQCIDVIIENPMYLKRLINTACQLPDCPEHMFKACHSRRRIEVSGFCSRFLAATSKQCQTTILTPTSATLQYEYILKPQYWINPDTPHEIFTFESEGITITGTKPKLMVVAKILDEILGNKSHNFANSTLLQDASHNIGMPYLEVSMEGMLWKMVTTSTTKSINATLTAVKAFVYNQLDAGPGPTASASSTRLGSVAPTHVPIPEAQQILFISGPESSKKADDAPLFTFTLQYPLDPENQTHLPIFLFDVQETKVCVDPLLCRWLIYTPKQLAATPVESTLENSSQRKNRAVSEATGSTVETPRRAGTPHESIHSSSDREHMSGPRLPPLILPRGSDDELKDIQERIYEYMKTWFPVWKNMLLCGEIWQCTIYLPARSLSAVGSRGIQEAVEEAVRKDNPPEVLVITLPCTTICSASQRQGLSKLTKHLPIKLPNTISPGSKSGFPWIISVTDLSCYTLQLGAKLYVLKPLSVNATVGVSSKLGSEADKSEISSTSLQLHDCESDIGPLAICVHIDMTSINISMSEIQICLIASILYGLSDVISSIIPESLPASRPKSPEVTPNFIPWSPSVSPTLVREATIEDTLSEQIVPMVVSAENIKSDDVKFTAWVQWTITRCTIALLSHDLYACKDESPNLKIVVDAEDIVSSLDFQSVFLKVKSKVAGATIQHFKRSKSEASWKHGRFLGLVMRTREEPPRRERQEDTGFIAITLTRASLHRTHALWSTLQKSSDKKLNQAPKSQFITEIVVTMQPIDFVISPKSLRSFYTVLQPLTQFSKEPKEAPNVLLQINNQTLPLIYVDCQGIRLILPSSEPGFAVSTEHDVCVFQIEAIKLTPTAVNPICRTPCRPDIYQNAAQSRILNIPGSELEDRQYQVDMMGMSLITGTWQELDPFLNEHSTSLSHLRTMSENPALEWNKAEGKRLNLTPQVALSTVVGKFDILIVMAPAMVYKTSTLVCGHSIEVNLISDVQLDLSLSQIKLMSALTNELFAMFESDHSLPRQLRITFPYLKPESGNALESSGTERDLTGRFDSSDFTTRDSGIEIPSTSVKSKETPVGGSIFPRSSTGISQSKSYSYVPVDVLFTGGKAAVALYEVINQNKRSKVKHRENKNPPLLKESNFDKGYEASEEGSVVDERQPLGIKQYNPLIFVSVSQPNAFLSRLQIGRKVQLSCFDVRVKIGGIEYVPLKATPSEQDYPINLLETMQGMPNPSTGIPPAFFSLKWAKGIGKPAMLDVDIGRPTRILCSVNRWNYLAFVKDKVLEAVTLTTDELASKTELSTIDSVISSEYDLVHKPHVASYDKFNEIKNRLHGISSLKLRLSQIVFLLQTENSPDVSLSVGRLRNQLIVLNRPERVNNVTVFESVTLGVGDEGAMRLMLNPWSFSVDTSLFWESWQRQDSKPQLQISIDSDSVMVDLSPDLIQCVRLAVKDFGEHLANLNMEEEEEGVLSSKMVNERDSPVDRQEQHYKDDLQAGAFQFTDASSIGSIEELPLPYQVVFWSGNLSAMAWRYPQPRTLTKVRVIPVPFREGSEGAEYQVLCRLEYYSECHACYRPYAQFYLSETELCHLELPQLHIQPVACVWRVVLHVVKEESEHDLSRCTISSRVLAACMRIDSYFNKNLVPDVTLALEITSVNVSLYNDFDKSIVRKMPDALKHYTCDSRLPEKLYFLTFTLDGLRAYLATWNLEAAVFDISTSVKCTVVDYAFLTQQNLLEPSAVRLEVGMSKEMSVSAISKPIQINMSPSIGHTLAVSAQMWKQRHDGETDLVVVTRFVVCNDTNVNLRFGQAATDEDILLPPRCCHLYAWRTQKLGQTLRVAVEQNAWVWSRGFMIANEGSELCRLESDSKISLVVAVENLSATQKRVTFAGQLVICNMLQENFECKVVPDVKKDREKEFKKATSHVVAGRCNPPSLLIDTEKKYHLRIRFFGLESTWSGDIPLMENAKCVQPWLVKVPLQERGQFLSIWCRIWTRKFKATDRILVTLWPLFMIRSNLPTSVNMQIQTPSLNVTLNSRVSGKGEVEQLYCPGTIDHSHQLTFTVDGESPTGNPYVPLSYGLVEHREFFKKLENGDSIANIVNELVGFDKRDWPPCSDKDLEGIDWICEEQASTSHVQVLYKSVCKYSSALMLELIPWCLLINMLGCPIAVIEADREVCRVSHHGIATPPRLEETFHIGVGSGDTLNRSLPLQIAKSDWSQTFYMPTITGTIPLEGCIKTVISCSSHVCMVSISSTIANEIRLLRVCSTHVLTNHTLMQLRIVCLAVPNKETVYDVPSFLERHSFAVAPRLDKSKAGVSIIQWYVVDDEMDVTGDIALYVCVSANVKHGWSCPIRVDTAVARQNLVVRDENQSIPLLLTSTEEKGQLFLGLHHDTHPQLLIDNRSGSKLYLSQQPIAPKSSSNNFCRHFRWAYSVENAQTTYYTMCSYADKFPALNQACSEENLVISCNSEGVQWSTPIDVHNYNDQFISVPVLGDVKVSVVSTVHTTFVVIASASTIEINARDVRLRLIMREKQEPSVSGNVEDMDEMCGFDVLPPPMEKSYTSLADVSKSEISKLLFVHTLPMRHEWEAFKINVMLNAFTLTFISDVENDCEQTEVASVVLDDVLLIANQEQSLQVLLCIKDLQLDNQLHCRGNYDFPVVLISKDVRPKQRLDTLNASVRHCIETAQRDTVMKVDLTIESWRDSTQSVDVTEIKSIKVDIQPLRAYVEDSYVMKLKEYFTVLSPSNLVLWPRQAKRIAYSLNSELVGVPTTVTYIFHDLSRPLVIQSLTISPISLHVSVHWSIKVYLALDQSPLSLWQVEHTRLMTTPYRLGHALGMHYLMDAVFGCHWMVGSLELIGSPGGLARAMSSGLHDFVNLPYRGLMQGPWAFLRGVTHGSASLMRHITAGTLQSVTKLASSVARNLDRLTLDEEHLRRTEEYRRQRPQGLTQGLLRGLTGLGISLLGAVGGIAHHPLNSLITEGASPRGLVRGVGVGLVGVIAKPLSGAADLVALAGEGLLQGAGWNPLPKPRATPAIHHTYSAASASLKYTWKLLQTFTQSTVIFITDATCLTSEGEYRAAALILTTEYLIIANTDQDVTQRIISLPELSSNQVSSDPTLLSFRVVPVLAPVLRNTEEEIVEMDPACRARVVDYVQSTVGLMHLRDDVSPEPSEMGIVSRCGSPGGSNNMDAVLNFYVSPQNRNYFLVVLGLAQQQRQNCSFPVL